ncbi:MAG: DHH family phosphoesterase [Bacteroidales bacterium]|nr:DHH family phosphoesterase [Bacteroidales bacterium]
MNLTKNDVVRIEEVLATCPEVAIVSHYNPDGDAVGSSLALYHFFKNAGCKVTSILANQFPDFLHWMPGSGDILIAENHLKKAKSTIENAKVLFVVDMNAPHRAGENLCESITNAKGFRILIDHHILPNIECDAKLSTPKTTSTCELVYEFIAKYLKKKKEITRDIAECLYTGMITDTGSLSYACNRARTYQILAHLVKTGIDCEQIHRNIFDNYSETRMRLLGHTLANRMKVMPEYATSYTYLTKQDLKDFHFKPGDTEGFVNYGLSINTVKFTAFFTERENRIRISFRSKGSIDTSKFARENFGGGGHKNASAAYSYDSLEETIRRFEELVVLHKDELMG